MPKKKVTKKAKKKEDYVPAEEFNLEVTTDAQANELIEHMTNLQFTTGWLLLKKIMEGNIAVLEKMIIERIDIETGRELTDEELDVVRHKRKLMKELIEKPQSLIDKFKKKETVIPSYDPYATEISTFTRK